MDQAPLPSPVCSPVERDVSKGTIDLCTMKQITVNPNEYTRVVYLKRET